MRKSRCPFEIIFGFPPGQISAYANGAPTKVYPEKQRSCLPRLKTNAWLGALIWFRGFFRNLNFLLRPAELRQLTLYTPDRLQSIADEASELVSPSEFDEFAAIFRSWKSFAVFTKGTIKGRKRPKRNEAIIWMRKNFGISSINKLQSSRVKNTSLICIIKSHLNFLFSMLHAIYFCTALTNDFFIPALIWEGNIELTRIAYCLLTYIVTR